jgi:CheY-like chemotaxis protein/anti-sigma regulatory factor (Ser/Thr protein kinase)
LDRQIVDLNQVVQHAIETVRPLIEQHKHRLVLNLCEEPAWASVDATRIEEVLVNLLNNAAKYTPDGGRIVVTCEAPAGMTVAHIRVRDNGVGIDEELLPRIFELFTQADRSLDRSHGGLGIGLSLAHWLVDLHGGTIEAHSPAEGNASPLPHEQGIKARGPGSEFIVKLPLVSRPRVAAAAAPDQASRKPEGSRVLVVDDNIDLVMMLAASLRQKGYGVQTAYTGPDGLQVAQQWGPDVVILDIGLPGLDGYEVARRLRADQATQAARIIAVTGYGRDADVALAREAGFDAHLVKPYALDELEKLMVRPPGVAAVY